MKIILASQSPRRIKLLENINLSFTSKKSFVNENLISVYQKPHNYCMNVANAKTVTIFKEYPNSFIIGADTIVYFNKSIIGKPRNKTEAKDILQLLSNNTHIVYTGVSMKSKNIKIQFYDKTFVTFNPISINNINYYIENYNPFDKAGSYGIQDWGHLFIKKINGCYNNVIGFPVSKFYKLVNNNNSLKHIINYNNVRRVK